MAKPDRERIGAMPRENYDELNKVIMQFRSDFQAKYHQEFVFRPEMLRGAEITLGTDKNTVTVSLPDLEKNSAVTPGDSQTAGGGTEPGQAHGIPKKTGLPVVSGPTVPLIDEAGNAAGQVPAWKVDIPNEITGRKLTIRRPHGRMIRAPRITRRPAR
jgi:hypothetical protein